MLFQDLEPDSRTRGALDRAPRCCYDSPKKAMSRKIPARTSEHAKRSDLAQKLLHHLHLRGTTRPGQRIGVAVSGGPIPWLCSFFSSNSANRSASSFPSPTSITDCAAAP